MSFDNLEYITVENQRTDFPKHFHETFCISLIHNGVEQIDFDKQSLFTEAGSISITNPYEIHSNPVIEDSVYLTFDTIYMPSELMEEVLNGKIIKFVNRQIKSKKVNQLFLDLKNALDIKNAKNIDLTLSQFVNALKFYSQENEKEYSGLNFHSFGKIDNYIEERICDKFELNELSKMANINKFGFAKKFKTFTGMTPMNYILMRKIFSSKKLISSNSKLTEIAYKYNFTDIAHFSKTFKRFVGISPQEFKNSKF